MWIASTKRLRKTRMDPIVVCGHAYSISVRELLHTAWVFSADSMTRFFQRAHSKGSICDSAHLKRRRIYERGLFQAQKEMTTDHGLVQNASKYSCLVRIYHSCHDPSVATHVKVTIMTDTKGFPGPPEFAQCASQLGCKLRRVWRTGRAMTRCTFQVVFRWDFVVFAFPIVFPLLCWDPAL